jgi:hypothetical protein
MRKLSALMAGLLMAIGMISVQGASAQPAAAAPATWGHCEVQSALCLYEYINGGGLGEPVATPSFPAYNLSTRRFNNGRQVDNNSSSVWNTSGTYGAVVHDYYNCNGEPGHSKVVNTNDRFNLGTYNLWHKVSSVCFII